eukprot:c31353_g1_i1 orf=2-280(-)
MVIISRILQHCKDEKLWQRYKQEGLGQHQQQPMIVDWLMGEAQKKHKETMEGDEEVEGHEFTLEPPTTLEQHHIEQTSSDSSSESGSSSHPPS